MAFTINNLAIVSALVTLPLSGAWHADVRVSPTQGDIGAPLSGTVSLDLDGLTLSGTVLRSAVDDNLIGARIVGGKGKLGTALGERYYKGSPTVRKIVEDILRKAGETLDGASSPAVLDSALNTWQRAAGPAGVQLTSVLEAHGASWRVTPAGNVLVVGSETWPVADAQHVLVPGGDPVTGLLRVAWTESTPANVLPGVTFNGRRVRLVMHELNPDGLRTVLQFEEPRGFLERLRGVLVRDAPYSRLWPGVVEQQNADGTVDVVVANRFGLTQVPLRHGVPGIAVKVPQGVHVMVGFEADDPRAPFAALWPDGTSVTEVAFDGGTKAVARVDDTVDCGHLRYVPGSPGALFYTPPGGVEVVVSAAPPGTSISAVITSGNAKLRA